VRSLPIKDSTVDHGLLCVKGKFGFDVAQRGSRITKPLIRKEGRLEEVSWEEALLHTAKKAQGLSLLYGSNSLAVAVSDRYTNEEIFLASKFSHEILKTNNFCCFNNISGGIKDVLGYDASTNTFDELLSTEVIILIGSNVMKNHTIVGLKIKKAVEKGAKLIVINPFDSQADEWAFRKINPQNNTLFLKEIMKALIEQGYKPKANTTEGFDDLEKALEMIIVSDEAKEIAKIYGSAKKAMIVFEQNRITAGGAKILANISVIADHIRKPRSGIIQLKANNNGQGLNDVSNLKDSAEIIEGIQAKSIKGLLVFGEDISHINLNRIGFLMVQDTHLTETAKKADVVLPGVSFAESCGTFTSSERKIQKINQAIKPLVEYENWQVIIKLANALSKNIEYLEPSEIMTDISKNVQEYSKINKLHNRGVFWPVNGSPVLYTEGYNFSDRKAKLQVVNDTQLFTQPINTNNLYNEFIEYLIKEQIF
ncbi:MAG: molybdopterin-dependent oxidoreductase, partial [Alkaliphilus sp.]|nr:molybdopterin-dependent oxidoreductase [Alkaliphilus sp.]